MTLQSGFILAEDSKAALHFHITGSLLWAASPLYKVFALLEKGDLRRDSIKSNTSFQVVKIYHSVKLHQGLTRNIVLSIPFSRMIILVMLNMFMDGFAAVQRFGKYLITVLNCIQCVTG